MKFFITFLFSIFTALVYAQTITVKMEPASFNRVVLYAAHGAQQKYVTHQDATDGVFNITLATDAPQALYRMVFDQKTMDYIDFLYLGKPFTITFNPKESSNLPDISGSDENTRYYNNLFAINQLQHEMDSLQVLYFQENDVAQLTKWEAVYATKTKSLSQMISQIEQQETNPLIKDVLLAHARVLPDSLEKNPTDYLSFTNEHFFDRIDFNNPNLINTSILVDKMMDFVFYLTVAEDEYTQNEMYKKAVTTVLHKIPNDEIRKGFIQSLIQSFSQDENVTVIDYLFTNFYDKLPVSLQNKSWKNGLQHELSTAVGRKAPNFNLKFNQVDSTLYDLDGYDLYIIVFWSTSCSHCMKEIPMFYDYIKEDKKVKVIAIGMETEETKSKWLSETYYYPEFINVLGLGKWENPIARSYNVHATPNYFILDKNKQIIHKPYDFEAVEEFFQTKPTPSINE